MSEKGLISILFMIIMHQSIFGQNIDDKNKILTSEWGDVRYGCVVYPAKESSKELVVQPKLNTLQPSSKVRFSDLLFNMVKPDNDYQGGLAEIFKYHIIIGRFFDRAAKRVFKIGELNNVKATIKKKRKRESDLYSLTAS